MKDILLNMKVLNARLLVLLLALSPIAVVSSIGASAQSESITDRASTHLQHAVDTINDKMIDAKVTFTSLIKAPPPRNYSQDRQPCLDFSHEKKAFFGDLHVHTKYSLDASTQSTRTSPDQAYRFAKGEVVGIQPWQEGEALRSLQLDRPLDFAMVSDHAELFGETFICNTPGQEGYSSWQCKIYRHIPRAAFYLFNATATVRQTRLGFCGDDGELCRQAGSAPWLEMQTVAEQHDDKSDSCEFTAFIGYEWTGGTKTGANLHRNVVFRNAEVPSLPVSWVDGSAQYLWQTLESQCDSTDSGCEALTIPHNSNISSGFMFNLDNDGTVAMTEDQFALRKKYEPIVEIMQHKGASECFYSKEFGSDELCAFEFLPVSGFFGGAPTKAGDGFVRDVLKEGLIAQQKSGMNPFHFGFIGSSDTHLGTPGAVEENVFLGHGGAGVPAGKEIPPGLPDYLKYNPGGLAVIWAEENSRDALFDAMQRGETYATSGPRIETRLFGGWDYSSQLCESKVFAQRGYEGGVPMGGTLVSPTATESSPVFAVSALQDPGSSRSSAVGLQRIQMVKGWIDAEGKKQEQVYDIAGSIDNGATLNVNTCTVSGEHSASLCSVWQDPDFQAEQPAFYYTRVLENPTCRWSQRQCVANGVNCSKPDTITDGFEGCCVAEHRPVIQERAWSSPIWYEPVGGLMQ
ncbi:MAG: hypothetical protein CL691_02770 [Cellvibrionales bacterium]|nr:hypothetical protein [Cellvibrionales bacterium]